MEPLECTAADDVPRLPAVATAGVVGVQDGEGSRLVDASRRVIERSGGIPRRLEVEVHDELGRTLRATGTTRNRYANWATPGSFAWMSMVEWELADGTIVIGEDQEVWSPDRIGPPLSALDT